MRDDIYPYSAVGPESPGPETLVMNVNEAETFLRQRARWQDRTIELLLWRNPPTREIRVGPLKIVVTH